VGNLGKSASGKVVTYKGFPLFHFSGDKAAGQTAGSGIASFGGTWTVVKAGSTPGT
jgi:predicted lipoprotein with Yx(FWY)xxD motif